MKGENMEFNWEEFISNDKIAVHCETEEQAKDFCRKMHEHGLEWNNGKGYLEETYWNACKENTCYDGRGMYEDVNCYKRNNYTILEWSDYQKENSMNLELTNLTEEQKKQIIELAKKFEQENEIDELDKENDYIAISGALDFPIRFKFTEFEFKDQLFNLGLTAHTKEDAEKIRRRLLVEKELRDWAKKCKKPVRFDEEQEKYLIEYNVTGEVVYADSFVNYVVTNILFSEKEILEQAIESIGQERLIRDYFGIDI